MRDIINAILYVNKTGCQWRMLPRHFPAWFTVYNHFWRLQERGVWEQLNTRLNELARQKKGARPRRAISSLTPKASRPATRDRREGSTAARRSRGAAAR